MTILAPHLIPNISIEQLQRYAARVTPAQLTALQKVRQRWTQMSEPVVDTLMNCVLVHVGTAEQPNQMLLGVEPDGYTHS